MTLGPMHRTYCTDSHFGFRPKYNILFQLNRMCRDNAQSHGPNVIMIKRKLNEKSQISRVPHMQSCQASTGHRIIAKLVMNLSRGVLPVGKFPYILHYCV